MFKQLVILALVATVSSQQFEDPTMNIMIAAKEEVKKEEVKKEEVKKEETKKADPKKADPKKADPKKAEPKKKLTKEEQAAADKKAAAVKAKNAAFMAAVENLPDVHFIAPAAAKK